MIRCRALGKASRRWQRRAYSKPGARWPSGSLSLVRSQDEIAHGRRLLGDQAALVANKEAAVELLGNGDLASGIPPVVGAVRDLDPAVAQSDGVVAGDESGVVASQVRIEIPRGRSPGVSRILGCQGESAVVVLNEGREASSGVLDGGGSVEAQDADEAILERAPESLDSPLGLRASRGDVADAEGAQDLPSLGWFSLPGELLLEAPMGIVAYEDARPVSIERGWHAVGTNHLAEQKGVAVQVLVGPRFERENCSCGIVYSTDQGESGRAILAPAVFAGVHKDQSTASARTLASTSMLRRAAPALGPKAQFRSQALDHRAGES